MLLFLIQGISLLVLMILECGSVYCVDFRNMQLYMHVIDDTGNILNY